MPRLLILLTLPPDVTEQYRQQLSRKFPELTIDVCSDKAKAEDAIKAADMLLTFGQMLKNLKFDIKDAVNLKWIQALGTGMDGITDQPSLKPSVTITSLHGVHGAPVSEAAIAGMFTLARDIPRFVRNQDTQTWGRWPASPGLGVLVADEARDVAGEGEHAGDGGFGNRRAVDAVQAGDGDARLQRRLVGDAVHAGAERLNPLEVDGILDVELQVLQHLPEGEQHVRSLDGVLGLRLVGADVDGELGEFPAELLPVLLGDVGRQGQQDQETRHAEFLNGTNRTAPTVMLRRGRNFK